MVVSACSVNALKDTLDKWTIRHRHLTLTNTQCFSVH